MLPIASQTAGPFELKFFVETLRWPGVSKAKKSTGNAGPSESLIYYFISSVSVILSDRAYVLKENIWESVEKKPSKSFKITHKRQYLSHY